MSAPQTDRTFDPTALESTAIAQSGGLKNFGDPSYRIALEKLCASLEAEAKLSDFGRQLLHQKFIEMLVNRLRMEEFFRTHPEINDEVLAAPVLIVGLPRTGTTLLQRVLACDPSFYSMPWWESRYPVPFVDEDLKTPTARIERARGEVKVMVEAMPKLMAIHPMNADEADEEGMLTEHSFRASFNAYAHVPSYMEWLHSTDETPTYEFLKRGLKFLQWQKRQRGIVANRWVLKAPHHLLRMELVLKMFPGIQVIQTHRDPVETIPSIASFIDTLWHIYSSTVDSKAVGHEWSALMARAFRHALQAREQSPQSFMDVRFIDTVKTPLEVVRAIYAFAGRTLTTEAEARMTHWIEDNRRESRASHDYQPEQFGLSEKQLKQDFADYRRQYIEPATI